MNTTTSRYFRISLTNQCSLSCYFCHNEGQSFERNVNELSTEDIIWVCKLAYEYGFRKFKLTGGEPTLRGDICEIIENLSQIGIHDLSIITNGTTLYKLADKLKLSGLTRLNVSLYTLNENRFVEINGGSIQKLNNIVKGIDAAIDAGFTDMKINFVFHGSKSMNDLYDMLKFALSRNLILVFLPLLLYNLKDADEQIKLNEIYTVLSNIGIKNEYIIQDNEGIKKKLITLNIGTRILLRVDELGIIKPYETCEICTKKSLCREGIFPIRLSSDGVLRPCLAGGKQDIHLYDIITSRNNDKFYDYLLSI